MNLDDAIKIFRQYTPCFHENYEVVGIGNIWAKCIGCEADFQIANIHAYRKSLIKYEEAMDCLDAIKHAVE